ncbi:MAG: ATP-binding protein, partial [Gemmatimonadota bacterium]|nr:ATP-binding protein [Gemmatimonadota bacterium]
AALLAPLLAARLARPLERLGDTARRVHLGRLDVKFRGEGGREFRRLSRFLNGMLDRLRAGVIQIREAERRATLGELARQVNHDVRNGLVPIRNVLSHLGEAQAEGPDALAQAFSARRTTLRESLDYLDALAQQYRSVAIHGQRAPADLDATVAGSVEAVAASAQGVVFETLLGAQGRVRLDPVSLRRVVENLIRNAVDAVGDGGAVRVRTCKVEESGEPAFQLEVSDDGPGIPPEHLSRVFEPFFTTRADGTGLGLAIVRRMVSDVGGRVTLDSREGVGTSVRVTLPAQGDYTQAGSGPGTPVGSESPKGAT